MELVSTMEINGEEREIADAVAREQCAANADGIAELNNNLVEQKMLGWTVPSECPIQNEVNGNQFIQKVSRIDLSTLSFSELGSFGYYVEIPTSKAPINNSTVANIYLEGFKTVKRIDLDSSPNSIAMTGNKEFCINNGKIAIPSGYLYYELETPITMNIDGNEAITKINESLADYGLLNKFDGKWEQGIIDYQSGEDKSSTSSVRTPTFYNVDNNGFVSIEVSETYAWIGFRFFDVNKNYIKEESVQNATKLESKAPSNAKYVRFVLQEGYDFTPSNVGKTIIYIDNAIDKLKNDLFDVKANMSHNIPRTIPKDITSYYNDGTIWKRLNGTDGFSKYEDIFVGDYFKMSRAISAYNQDQNYQLTGSDWVTIAGISTLLGNGDTGISYEHLVMVPGKGFGGTQHFGRSRMNPTHTTVGGYVGSEMHTTTIGEVVSSGSTATTATINQQLYAEFGSHLKTTRELLSNSLNSTGYNRFGSNTGCSNNWIWTNCQAVLMSEIELYGSIVWSSSGYDTGNANKQLPLFVNSKQAINNRSAWYWLKDVASASNFCICNNNGIAYYNNAGYASDYVRPRFVIAA